MPADEKRSKGRPMPQVAARISPEIELRLKQFFKTKSAGAEFILPWAMEMFHRTMNQLREELSPAEMRLILEAYRDKQLLPEQSKLSYLQLRTQEACEEESLHTKFGVNPGQLEYKLRKLTDAQAAALMIWAVAYWTSKVWRNVPPEEYVRGDIELS
jgi:hypothetical protein